jgi:tight adherence protein C
MNLDPALLLTIGLSAGFLAAALFAYSGVEALAQRRSVNRSLRSMQSSELPAGSVRQQELAVPVMRRVVLPGLSGISRRILRFTPPSIVERLDQELVYAGSPAGWDGARLLALKWLAAAAVGLLTVFGLPVLGVGVLQALIVALVTTLIGYYLPEWMFRATASRRQEQIRKALPDALDLLSITVQAGLGFDAALEKVSKEMAGPLGEELYRVVQEIRLGKGRGEALRSLGERTTVDELKAFVMAMVQAEIFGISISRVLEVQAEESRVKRRQRAEEQAQKLPVKIIFPLVLCIFPAILAITLGPAAITIYQELLTQL